MRKKLSILFMVLFMVLVGSEKASAIDLNGEIVSSSSLKTGTDPLQEGGNLSWRMESVIYEDQLVQDCGYWTLIIEGNGAMLDYAPEYCCHYGWLPVPSWSDWKNPMGDFRPEESFYVFVGEGITHIGDFAFNSFGNVMYITLPEGVTTIGKAAFAGCCNLLEITIPKSVTSIGEGAFTATNGSKVIRCYSGSYAHQYAIENGINYYLLDKSKCENNGHSAAGSATCTANLTCRVCGEVMEQATGHNWSDWSAYYGSYERRICSSCGDSETRKVSVSQKVTSISITGKSTTLLAGKKLQLTANISPSNAENKEVTWTTSNKKYATVTAKGLVKAKAAGAGKTVTITATAKDGSGKKDTYTITIKGAVKKIKLTAAKKTVKAGKKLTIKATVTVGTGGSKELKWTSSNKKYATVNANGVVTTKKAGKGKTVTITAKAKDGSGKKAAITIKIK